MAQAAAMCSVAVVRIGTLFTLYLGPNGNRAERGRRDPDKSRVSALQRAPTPSSHIDPELISSTTVILSYRSLVVAELPFLLQSRIVIHHCASR